MSHPEACGSCRYWRHSFANVGGCRRRAPTVVWIEGTPNGEWPLTTGDGWCGEYEESDEAALDRLMPKHRGTT